ncbi:hypothetical protein KUCAC02_025314, partial [Chaenocephalus aceratus]
GAVVQWVKGDDAARERPGEWSTAGEVIMRAQSYFKRLTRDMKKAEMRPLMWNDMPD